MGLRRRTQLGIGLGLIGAAVLALWGPARAHLRALDLLLAFQSGEVSGEVPARREPLGELRARRYGEPGGQPVLLLHGAHPGGIDEPRLVRFAHQLAERGFYVVTPELAPLAALRFEPGCVDDVRAAARALAAERGAPSVGVIGVSVGGGVALRAAARTEAIGAVWAIGAHHDLGALLEPWMASTDERYGARALAHAYAEEYFEAPDGEAAAAAMRAAFGGEPAEIPALSDRAHRELAWLTADPMPEPARRRLRAIRDRHADDLSALSPRAALAEVRGPVYLLHGASDPLIPPSESTAIAGGLSPDALGGVLVTPLLRHAEGASERGVFDEWHLVHLVAGALEEL